MYVVRNLSCFVVVGQLSILGYLIVPYIINWSCPHARIVYAEAEGKTLQDSFMFQKGHLACWSEHTLQVPKYVIINFNRYNYIDNKVTKTVVWYLRI